MQKILTLIMLLPIMGCDLGGVDWPKPAKLSDGYISFLNGGTRTVIADSILGEASAPFIFVIYDSANNMWSVSGTKIGTQLTLVFRHPFQPGRIPLDLPSIHFNDTSTNSSAFEGNATLTLTDDHWSKEVWSTNSQHVGTLDITSIDSDRLLLDGKFQFNSERIDNPGSTTSVDSGMLSRVRIQRKQKF